MSEGLDSVSAYLTTVSKGRTTSRSEATEAPSPLSHSEQVVLRSVLQSPERLMKTSEVVAQTGLGILDVGTALSRLSERGIVEVRGEGGDEEVLVPTQSG